MNKVLFICKNYNFLKDGSSVIIKRNLSLLKDIYGDSNVDIVSLEYSSLNTIKRLSYILTLGVIGFDKKVKKQLDIKISTHNYDFVFVDNSIYGGIAKYIKSAYPSLKIITFFHNVERQYFKDKIKVEGIKNTIMYPYIVNNERSTAKYSDKILCLNHRDKKLIEKFYGKKADFILPTSIKDKFNADVLKHKTDDKYYIFVGSDFYANVEGLDWYIKNVSDKIPIKLKVIGSGLEKYKERYINYKNAEIIGFVEDIGQFYTEAEFVVIPIFSGSGMKTKTAEALMYGKYIFGSDEAFEGYDMDCSKVGGSCNSIKDYENSINKFIRENHSFYNEYAREIYLQKYSYEIVLNNFKKYLEEIKWI